MEWALSQEGGGLDIRRFARDQEVSPKTVLRDLAAFEAMGGMIFEDDTESNIDDRRRRGLWRFGNARREWVFVANQRRLEERRRFREEYRRREAERKRRSEPSEPKAPEPSLFD